MILSVIIPTRNRKENLRHTLHALTEQSLNREYYEVIISDDNSEDNTFELYNEYRPQFALKYVNNNTKPHSWNASVPRNLGAQVANLTTQAYVFLDSDVLLPPDALDNYRKNFEENKDRVIIGPYDFMQPNGNDVMQRDVRFDKFQNTEPHEVFDTIHDGLACFGGNLLIPRNIFWSVGGYSEDTHIGLEDGEMGIKLWKKSTKFSYDKALYGKHQWHETPSDRFPPNMAEHIDKLNKKHFNMSTSEVDKSMDIITASKETYAQWGIDWTPPQEWLKGSK